jgi:hypothetical protein
MTVITEELRAALKRSRRMQSVQEAIMGIVSIIGLCVPWYYEFGRTDTLIWYAGMIVVGGFYSTERRLKVMQRRLAQMHDALDRLESNEAEDHLIAELDGD